MLVPFGHLKDLHFCHKVQGRLTLLVQELSINLIYLISVLLIQKTLSNI